MISWLVVWLIALRALFLLDDLTIEFLGVEVVNNTEFELRGDAAAQVIYPIHKCIIKIMNRPVQWIMGKIIGSWVMMK